MWLPISSLAQARKLVDWMHFDVTGILVLKSAGQNCDYEVDFQD